MFKRMLRNLSGRFQLWDTSQHFTARGWLSQSEKSSIGYLKQVSDSIGLLSPSSPASSASRMTVSGSPSPAARTSRIYPAVSSSPSIQIPAVRKSSPSVSCAEPLEVRTSAIYQQIRRFEVFAACRCSALLLGGPSCPSPSRRARELS